MRNEVQLIVYADRFGGTIARVAETVRAVFGDAVGGVHLLPFFTPYDGADAGFDPIDHTAVDPRLGTWDDVRALGTTHDTVVDVIVNHMSSSSPQFADVVEKGDDSVYAGMFLTFAGVFPDGATEAELTAIYRPRPGLPFVPARLGGDSRLLWCTFTPQQIDIDVRSEAGRAYLDDVLGAVASAGVTLVRLDAVGYAVKTPGTSSFMTPETFSFIDAFTALARERGLEVLVEVHSFYRKQIEIGERVDRVYDFALPPLVLHALTTGDLTPLRRWLEVRPHNAITVLDTHDGIGVIDVGPDTGETCEAGLLTAEQIDALVDGIHERTGGQSRQATGAAASNLDLYQVNSTYYDALGRDDRLYLAARALQFFTPGIPQVYYVGALVGGNDMELLARTGNGRDINRHVYTPEEIAAESQRPVVRALLALMRLRSTHPAFDGMHDIDEDATGALTLTWKNGPDLAALRIAPNTVDTTLTWTDGSGAEQAVHDLRELAARPHA